MKHRNTHTSTRNMILSVAFLLAATILVESFVLAADDTYRPSGDSMTYHAWTPSTQGSQHYKMVDEFGACNGLTDYNYTTTVGQRDAYTINIQAIPTGSTITQIDITPCASRVQGGGQSTMDVFYRFNGTNSADAGNYNLLRLIPRNLATTSFTGLSLMKSGNAKIKIGAVYTSGSKGVRLSRLATVITYTTP